MDVELFIHVDDKYSSLRKMILIAACVSVCMHVDWAGEPAHIPCGVPAAVPQTGCAGVGGTFWQTQGQVQSWNLMHTHTNMHTYIYVCVCVYTYTYTSKTGSVTVILYLLCRFEMYKSQFIFFSNRMNDAQTRPRREYTPKPKPIFDFGEDNHSNGGYSTSMAMPPSRNSGKKQLVGFKKKKKKKIVSEDYLLLQTLEPLDH